MKKLILLLIIGMIAVSCSTLEHIPKEENLYKINLKKYTKKGFFITTEMYNGDYEPIALINYELYPEANYEVTGVRYFEDGKVDKKYKWIIKYVTIEEAMDSIYKQCVDMGADAIVNFKQDIEIKQYQGLKNPAMIPGITISGFAIKRK